MSLVEWFDLGYRLLPCAISFRLIYPYPVPPTHTHRDASIYTPLLLDPNAVYQPQLLNFGDGTINRVYRFKAK